MDTRAWIVEILKALIGGAATAAGSWLGVNGAGAIGLAVPVLNLKSLGIIMGMGAGTNLFAFLKQSPLPTTIERTSTKVVSKEIIETPVELEPKA